MFDFLKSIIKVNRKIVDIEANLHPVGACYYAGEGELEFEVYEDGCANIELELKRTNVPVGTVVEVVCGNTYLGELHISSDWNQLRIAFGAGETLPHLEPGQTVEMIIDGQVCFAGMFYND